MVGVTYQEIHLFVEFLKEQYGQGRPDYIEALNDLDGLVEVSYRTLLRKTIWLRRFSLQFSKPTFTHIEIKIL